MRKVFQTLWTSMAASVIVGLPDESCVRSQVRGAPEAARRSSASAQEED
jgi:hypothetical protein